MGDRRIYHLNRAEQELAVAEQTKSWIMRQMHLDLARLHMDAARGLGPNREDMMRI